MGIEPLCRLSLLYDAYPRLVNLLNNEPGSRAFRLFVLKESYPALMALNAVVQTVGRLCVPIYRAFFIAYSLREQQEHSRQTHALNRLHSRCTEGP